jgi:acyl-CoA synthetase (AMP-forming)/AMP-acid ligase II
VGIFDNQRRWLGAGEVGEIAVRTPVPFSHYLGMTPETASRFHNGWLFSGDVGVIDSDGRLRVIDRVVDMIVTGGENVYSVEVERVLAEHDGIVEAAVIGEPDSRWGERVVAIVVAANPALTESAVQEFCRERLAGYKVPKRVIFAETLPRNAMGKVQKGIIRTKLPSWTGGAIASQRRTTA